MQYKEMQVGDVVEITDKRRVTISAVDSAQNAYDENGRVIMADGPGERREFWLADRPLPPLPTKFGSVLEVTQRPVAYGPARWFLTEGEWISGTGARKSPTEFLNFIKRGRAVGRTYKVLA